MEHDFPETRVDLAEDGERAFTMAVQFPAERHLILPARASPLPDPAAYLPAPPALDDEAVFRILDIALSLALLIVMAPVMAIVSILITTTGAGPVTFSHCRLGRNGKPFNCHKFRTMRHGAEADLPRLLRQDHALAREWARDQKLVHDPRVTGFGHFLRVTSIDELPQLFNVLKGEMSLVGPRPIVADELARYGRYAGHYLGVKPGITGLWQVNGRNRASYRRRVAADVLFARKRSLPLVCRILLATVPAVLMRRGSC